MPTAQTCPEPWNSNLVQRHFILLKEYGMTTVTSLETYQPDVSKSEWETRVAVAASYRLLAHYRLSDLSN